MLMRIESVHAENRYIVRQRGSQALGQQFRSNSWIILLAVCLQ